MAITLRPLTDADLDAVFEWGMDPAAVELAAFTGADPSDRAAFDEHRARIAANPEVLDRGIEADGVLVGTVASFPAELGREVTYWVDRTHWGQGIASAGLQALLLLDPTRPIFARVAEHNVGSAEVLRRNGFVHIGTDSGWADGVGREVTETVHRLG